MLSGAGRPRIHQSRWENRQVEAQLLLQEFFRRFGLVAALVGDFQRYVTRAPGEACGATAERAGQANVGVILALQPEQRAAAGVTRGADADLAVDLPAVEGADLLLVRLPARRVAQALFHRFTGGQAGAASEQGYQGECE